MNTPEKIEHEAALWVVRVERGLTPAEQDEFLDWLGADPRHGEQLNRQQAGWDRLDLLADWRPEHGRRPNRDLLAPPPTKVLARWRPRVVRLFPMALAAAAVLAIGLFVFQLKPAGDVHAPTPTRARIALIEARTLEDGSTIELNRGAKIAIDYTPTERRVQLIQGEASFKVAKNPERPFIVSVRGVDVRAVGTAFNVQLKEDSVEVVVTEGKVRVDSGDGGQVTGVSHQTSGSPLTSVPRPPSPGISLIAGQRTIVSLERPTSAAVAAVTPEEMSALLSWQPQLLDFTDAPLASIVAEFNRRNAPIKLVVDDPALAGTVLNASLRSDNIEGFLRLLEGGFGIKAERAGEVVTLYRTRTK